MKKQNITTNNQNTNQIYQDYYEKKRIAMVMEENNNSKIIAIPSPNKGAEDEWLKLGGNSAYFYKYLIAPRLGKKPPTIRPDTDLSHRFKDGVISIHWKNLFLKNLASIDLTSSEENGLLIINLNHKFSSAEIKKLKSREKEKQTEINQLLRPKNTIPELYHLLLKLAKTLPPKIAKLREPYRSDFGSQINFALSELFITYTEFINKNLSKSEAKRNLTSNINKINILLVILNENKLLDYSTLSKVGHTLIDLDASIERNIKNANNSK